MTQVIITVLIVAYRRVNYLYESLKSVLDQTIDKNAYEVIVIKDFDWEYEQEFKKQGIEFVKDEQKDYCKKIYSVLNRINGSIVCFLDDDDLFCNKKIEHIMKIFNEHPGVALVQNNMCVINGNGLIIRDSYYRIHKAFAENEIFVNSYEVIKSILKRKIGFNGSSLSVRKELVRENMETLNKIEGSIEAFLLISTIAAGMPLYYDDSILTRYRLHDANNSFTKLNSSNRLRMYRRHLADWNSLKEIANNNYPWIYDIMEGHIRNLLILKTIFDTPFDKGELIRIIPDFLKLYHISFSRKLVILMVSVIALLSVKIARFLISVLSVAEMKF